MLIKIIFLVVVTLFLFMCVCEPLKGIDLDVRQIMFCCIIWYWVTKL